MPEFNESYDSDKNKELRNKCLERKDKIQKELEQTNKEITRLNKLKKCLRMDLIVEITKIERLASE